MSNKNVYETWTKKMQLQQIVNAAGRMSALGVSIVSSDVTQAMDIGSKKFIDFKDLINKSGQEVAHLLQVEAGYIVNSASAGIIQAIAGVIHRGETKYIQSPIEKVKVDNIPNEVIIPKGHNIDYGVPMEMLFELAGAKIVEAGWANLCTKQNVIDQITNRTVALFYVASHYCVQKSILAFQEMVKIAHTYKIPMIIDIAAETTIQKYINAQIDIIIWSGSKAIEGPTSGYVIGQKKYITYIKQEHRGLGRIMKVDKGTIFGALEALRKYVNTKEQNNNQDLIPLIVDGIKHHKDLTISIIPDEAQRNFSRIKIDVNATSKYNAHQLSKKLEQGKIGIYTRKHLANNNTLFIDVRTLKREEIKLIIEKFKAILS